MVIFKLAEDNGLNKVCWHNYLDETGFNWDADLSLYNAFNLPTKDTIAFETEEDLVAFILKFG